MSDLVGIPEDRFLVSRLICKQGFCHVEILLLNQALIITDKGADDLISGNTELH